MRLLQVSVTSVILSNHQLGRRGFVSTNHFIPVQTLTLEVLLSADICLVPFLLPEALIVSGLVENSIDMSVQVLF